MGNLRIKLKYKSFEIEIEGEEETVQAEFKDIKNNGLGNIVNGVDMNEPKYAIGTTLNQIAQIEETAYIDEIDIKPSSTNLLSLRDVVMRQLPLSETEWILVYAHFASEGGMNFFTPKNILELYESTKRKTHSRHANLSKNIKALFRKGYFSALNDEEYLLTEDGKRSAIEIVTRKHGAPQSKSKPISKISRHSKKETDTIPKKAIKSVVSTNKFEVLKDLNLREKGKVSLIDYIKDYSIKTNTDRITVIINYFNEVLDFQTVTADHIYTGFWELKCKIPPTFYNILTNAKSRAKLIDFKTMKEIKLSMQGQNHVRLDILKS